MRELEFLPEWYPRARRSRRMLLLHAWAMLMLIFGLGMWSVLADRNVRHERQALDSLYTQVGQTRAELDQLDKQLALKKQLQVQEQILSRIGTHVEATRMLAQLDSIMPKEMSVLDLSMETVETVQNASQNSSGKGASVQRQLKTRLVGIAPSDVDLANFLAKLTGVPIFQQVTLIRAADRSESGHLMREFEVSFCIDTSGPVNTDRSVAAIGD